MKPKLLNSPRFISQRDHYSCGPVALMNLHKAQGLRVTLDDLPRYRRLLDCTQPRGTVRRAMNIALGRKGRKVPYTLFKECLGAVVHTPPGKKRHGHYWLVYGKVVSNTGQTRWAAVNLYADETVSFLTWQKMKSYLKHSYVWMF